MQYKISFDSKSSEFWNKAVVFPGKVDITRNKAIQNAFVWTQHVKEW